MILKERQGLVEMIATPAERQRDLVGEHVLDLLQNIDERLCALEERLNLSPEKGKEFAARRHQIAAEIDQARAVYSAMHSTLPAEVVGQAPPEAAGTGLKEPERPQARSKR